MCTGLLHGFGGSNSGLHARPANALPFEPWVTSQLYSLVLLRILGAQCPLGGAMPTRGRNAHSLGLTFFPLPFYLCFLSLRQ